LLSQHGRIGLFDVTNGSNINLSETVTVEGEDVLVITPNEALEPNHRYRVSDTGAPYVFSVTGKTVGHSSYFYTNADGTGVDSQAPSLIDWNVAESHVGFPTNGRFTLDFNEPLDYLQCPIESSVSIREGATNAIAYPW
jgi:hypothetical protein